jgi:hypothetical protein
MPVTDERSWTGCRTCFFCSWDWGSALRSGFKMLVKVTACKGGRVADCSIELPQGLWGGWSNTILSDDFLATSVTSLNQKFVVILLHGLILVVWVWTLHDARRFVSRNPEEPFLNKPELRNSFKPTCKQKWQEGWRRGNRQESVPGFGCRNCTHVGDAKPYSSSGAIGLGELGSSSTASLLFWSCTASYKRGRKKAESSKIPHWSKLTTIFRPTPLASRNYFWTSVLPTNKKEKEVGKPGVQRFFVVLLMIPYDTIRLLGHHAH